MAANFFPTISRIALFRASVLQLTSLNFYASTRLLRISATTHGRHTSKSSDYGNQFITRRMTDTKEEKEWQKKLTPEAYDVCRKCGTEPPFTGALLHNKEKGTYTCACCSSNLFSSETKFDSGSGWPSFFDDLKTDGQLQSSVKQLPDPDGYRIEIRCEKCDSHLGHVFPDGPTPTGQRFCVNSLSLGFVKEGDESK